MSPIRIAGLFLVIGGLLALGWWALERRRAQLFQERAVEHVGEAKAVDESSIHPLTPPARSDSQDRPSGASGEAIARLEIPRLGLAVAVVEGSDKRALVVAPGHIRGTALPGEGGNVGVAGHRDTFFRPLRLIRPHDKIDVSFSGAKYQYTVVSTEIVGPKDVHVLRSAGLEALTLVTCYPFEFVGSAPQRFIVHAECTNCANATGER